MVNNDSNALDRKGSKYNEKRRNGGKKRSTTIAMLQTKKEQEQ